ncbi:NAD(P)/FAD-dependent oxidoreductase [Allocoleopsis sp.]|uniref:NAD(P)/FAD-dependent oxidoreductase n=1 Tax=Allocoleopsis sp. TaxID=3088169 RepID=UPI002FCE9973
MFDVVIIGAGIAGLTCAQQLHQAGYHLVVVEKSRGVGGRLATRRLYDTYVDHGVRYLEAQGKLVPQLIDLLLQRGILQTWTDTLYELKPPKPESAGEDLPHPSHLTCYAVPTGITAVAKFLATGLDIELNQRVQAITPIEEQSWLLTFDSSEIPHEIRARAVVVAIPAPQAFMLLEPLATKGLSPEFLACLSSVEFEPCLSAIAGYPQAAIQDFPLACTVSNDSDLAWIGLDSSKRSNPQMPIFVLQSTAEFAQQYLNAEDLKPAGQQLLSRAAQLLTPWLDAPDWFQVHRWRYAFPKSPLNQDYLGATTPLPLVCCGDWCGGKRIDSALNSGLAAAAQINQQLQQRSLPREDFWNTL